MYHTILVALKIINITDTQEDAIFHDRGSVCLTKYSENYTYLHSLTEKNMEIVKYLYALNIVFIIDHRFLIAPISGTHSARTILPNQNIYQYINTLQKQTT